MSRVGNRLRALIPASRGEQKALAYRAGVRPETLNKILTGKTKEPGFETVVKLLGALNIQIDALIGGRETLRSVTPYESNEDYRRLIDALERADPFYREKILEHAMWEAELAASVITSAGEAKTSNKPVERRSEASSSPLTKEERDAVTAAAVSGGPRSGSRGGSYELEDDEK